MIKDSGERTAFDTGAVRDMHTGKGRMDLLPWHGIMEVSKHCEEGAAKYGEHNVDRGIPQHSLIDSGMRHLAKYLEGMDDEDHLRAAAWNILWALDQRVTHPEMNDLYAWNGKDGSGTEKEEQLCMFDPDSLKLRESVIYENAFLWDEKLHTLPKEDGVNVFDGTMEQKENE